MVVTYHVGPWWSHKLVSEVSATPYVQSSSLPTQNEWTLRKGLPTKDHDTAGVRKSPDSPGYQHHPVRVVDRSRLDHVFTDVLYPITIHTLWRWYRFVFSAFAQDIIRHHYVAVDKFTIRYATSPVSGFTRIQGNNVTNL